MIDRFIKNPELGKYELFGTKPSGEKVRVATVEDGQLAVFDEGMFVDLISDPREQITHIRRQRITPEVVERLTAPLDPGFAAQVRADLAPYVARGMTWEQALAEHSARTRSDEHGR